MRWLFCLLSCARVSSFFSLLLSYIWKMAKKIFLLSCSYIFSRAQQQQKNLRSIVDLSDVYCGRQKKWNFLQLFSLKSFKSQADVCWLIIALLRSQLGPAFFLYYRQIFLTYFIQAFIAFLFTLQDHLMCLQGRMIVK